ncbi:hypothetical protein MMC07_001853 [Pseudocyphellaria aurata]|nr:hypothetical protein [Pseudocyphellaria aurata]
MRVESLFRLLFIALVAMTVSAAPWYQGSLKFIRSAVAIQQADGLAPSPYDRKRHEVIGLSGTAPIPVSKTLVLGASVTSSAPAGTSTANNLNAIGGGCNATFSAVEKRHPQFRGPINRYNRRALGTGAPFPSGTGGNIAACPVGIAPTGTVGQVAVAATGTGGVAVAGTTASAVAARRGLV